MKTEVRTQKSELRKRNAELDPRSKGRMERAVTREPQAALLEPPDLMLKGRKVEGLKGSNLEPPASSFVRERESSRDEPQEFIAERRERLLRRQIDYFDAAPPEPRWESDGLADWRAQQRSARRCAIALWVLLLGGIALIGATVVAAELGWL